MSQDNKISEIFSVIGNFEQSLNTEQTKHNNLNELINTSSNQDELSDKLSILENATSDSQLIQQISELQNMIKNGANIDDIKLQNNQ